MFTTLSHLCKLYPKTPLQPSTYTPTQHSCYLCKHPLTFPLRCKGCNMRVCTACARIRIKNKQRCPRLCRQTPWHLQPEQPTGVRLKCPFGCSEEVFAETWEGHLVHCAMAPQEIRNIKTEEQLKQEYLCFLSADQLKLILRQCCSLCQTPVVRSRCPTCSISYCCRCRPPLQMTTRHCPLKHKLMIKDTILKKTYCDYCAKRMTSVGGGYCYTDPKCDLDVCINCYEGLPKEQMLEGYEIWEETVGDRRRRREREQEEQKEVETQRREGRVPHRMEEEDEDEEWVHQ